MKQFLLFVAISFCLSLSAQTKVNVPSFQTISASGSLKVKLVQANYQRVEYKMISGDEDDLEIKVVDGNLKLGTVKSYFWWKRTKAEILVYHTGLSIVKASAGSSIVSADVLKEPNMEVHASSGAYIKATVDASDLIVDCSSGASIKLDGKSQKSEMEVSSGGSIDADGHTSMEAIARSSSGGSLSIQVSKGLNAKASSGGSISYTGLKDNSKVDSKTSSGGSVSRMR